jgi:hypothetical protein
MNWRSSPFSVSAPTPQSGNVGAEMSLQKNVAGQNVTFGLTNASSNAALTGATVAANVSLDGGAQVSGVGTFTELGHGAYNYAPTKAETNGNCVSYLMTASNAVPLNMMFLTGGFHKNVAGQHVTFQMFTLTGSADTAASVTVYVDKDNGVQAAGSGTVTNLGNGQYDYAPTQAETNGTAVSFLFMSSGDVIQNILIFTVMP